MTDGGIHSTGRGGAGNIGVESETTSYTDGSIVREGGYGESGGLDYSAGRGGAGNIGKSPSVLPADKGKHHGDVPALGSGTPDRSSTPRTDVDVVPETATRNADAAPKQYHVGRGGVGNAHHDHTATGGHAHEHTATGEKKHEGIVEKIEDKVKHMLHKDHKEAH